MEELKNSVELGKRLQASLKRAADDLTRAEASRKRKAQCDVEKTAKKELRKKEVEHKKMLDSLKKIKGGAASGHDGPVFFKDLGIFMLLPVFEEASFKSGKLDSKTPYIVQVKTLANVVESVLQSTLSVFSAQFAMAPQARAQGRVQSPLGAGEAHVRKIKEAILSLKRDDQVSYFSDEDKDKKHNLVSDLCIFGFTGAMVYCGPEYQSLASFRYNRKGDRQVCILSFNDFWQHLSDAQRKVELTAQYNVTQFIQDVLQKCTAEDPLVKNLIQAVASGGDSAKCLWKGTVAARSLLYVPAGYLLVEQCLNNGINVGLRVSVRDVAAASAANLQALSGLHVSVSGKDSKYVQMYEAALTAA